jgi:predicted anti-sigma-YlaC factor YlaD
MVTNHNICHQHDIAAYLDGELNGEELASFETHLKSCISCAEELRNQRQLLCTLDAAFHAPGKFELPSDFTRVVAAHAESDLTGVHTRTERRRAAKICIVLALLSSAFLGTGARTLVFEPVRSFLHVAESLLDFTLRTIYDAGTGLAVIIRVIGHGAVSAPHGLGVLLVLAFLISVLLLPLLITRYHRAEIIE